MYNNRVGHNPLPPGAGGPGPGGGPLRQGHNPMHYAQQGIIFKQTIKYYICCEIDMLLKEDTKS